MSYTLTVPPSVVRDAENYAGHRGMTLNQLVCDYLITIVQESKPHRQLEIGTMRDEIKLPDDFDDAFTALDKDLANSLIGV